MAPEKDSALDRQPDELAGGSEQSVGEEAALASQRAPRRWVTNPVWALAIVLFLATLLCANYPILLGRSSGAGDVVNYSCPFFTLIADTARQGQLLLWSPLPNGGAPDGFEPTIGAASPVVLTIGLIWGGNDRGFRVYWMLMWCLGGLGMFALARHLNAAPWIACIAAIGYTCSALYTGHSEHTCFLVTMSLLPWAIWRLDVSILRRSWFPAIQAGAIWGLSGLGGYPGLMIAGGGYVVAWALGRAFFGDYHVQVPAAAGTLVPTAFGKLKSLVLPLALFFGTAFCVVSPSYVGFMVESRGYTSRAAGVSRDSAIDSWSVSRTALSTFSNPYLAIWNVKSPSPAWHIDASMASIYISPFLLIFAAGISASGNAPRFRWFLAAVAIFCLLIAMGGATPIYGWLHDLLPPFRYSRYPAIYRCFYIFTIPILAMLAVGDADKVLAGPRANAFWKTAFGIGLCAAVSAIVAYVYIIRWRSVPSSNPNDFWEQTLSHRHLVAVWLAVVLVPLLAWLCPWTLGRRILCWALVLLALAEGAATLMVTDWSLHIDRQPWREAAAEHVASIDLTSRGLDRVFTAERPGRYWNSNLLTKTPVLKGYTTLTNQNFDAIVDHPILCKSAVGAERIWFAPKAIDVPLTADSLKEFVAAIDRLKQVGIVVSDRKEHTRKPDETLDAEQLAETTRKLASLVPAQQVPVAVRDYMPNRLSFDVTVPEAGWLLVTDRWAAGWRATVNDKNVDVQIGNFVFRAIPVETGLNRIVFSYHPFGYPALLILSWGSLAAVTSGTVVAAARIRKPMGNVPI